MDYLFESSDGLPPLYVEYTEVSPEVIHRLFGVRVESRATPNQPKKVPNE